MDRGPWQATHEVSKSRTSKRTLMFNIRSTVVFGKKKKKKKEKQQSDLKELLAPTYKFARPRKGWWKIMTQEV